MKLPAQWSKVPLHQVANVQTGLSKSQNRTGPSVLRPYLRVANIQDGYLDLADIREIEVPSSQVERFSLRSGDLLLTEGGDFDKLGRGSIWNGEVQGCVHQNHVFAVRVIDSAVLLPEFLACEVQSSRAKNYFLSCAKQTTNLASINSSQLKNLPVLVPPLAEQHAVIDVSAIWDTAIQKAEQLLAAKKRHVTAISHQLLTARRRLARFSMRWDLLRADEIFKNTSRKGHLTEPLLSVTQEHGVIPRDMLEGRVTMPSGDTSGFKLVEPGYFVISLRSFQGGLEHSAYRGLVSPAYTVLSEKWEINGRFFRHYFKSADFIKRLSVAVIGIRDGKQISFQEFCSIKLPFPAVDEQAAIAALLDEAEREISVLLEYTEALKTQKRGLMQKLLTGQWRLTLPEPETV
ncbi:MAG: restriction endonuclease subunit S [Gammaproteobacteria bacterium]|nr:restriction endonuclease subunit S [Gammaproteobacteria bacterium]